jgi:hypothetical protein
MIPASTQGVRHLVSTPEAAAAAPVDQGVMGAVAALRAACVMPSPLAETLATSAWPASTAVAL